MTIWIIHCNCTGNWHIGKVLHSYASVMTFLEKYDATPTGHKDTYMTYHRKKSHLFQVEKVEMR